jgi:hypothetical protein
MSTERPTAGIPARAKAPSYNPDATVINYLLDKSNSFYFIDKIDYSL